MGKRKLSSYKQFGYMLYVDILKNVNKTWFGSWDVREISSPETTRFYLDNICVQNPRGRSGQWRWDDWSDRRLTWLNKLEKYGLLTSKYEGGRYYFKKVKGVSELDVFVHLI